MPTKSNQITAGEAQALITALDLMMDCYSDELVYALSSKYKRKRNEIEVLYDKLEAIRMRLDEPSF
jgi:hypothetical protein